MRGRIVTRGLGDLGMYKHRFRGFYETASQSTPQQLGVNVLIVTGCTTSVCVESTVRDAMFRAEWSARRKPPFLVG
jgi:nicotinamidase-related amidase